MIFFIAHICQEKFVIHHLPFCCVHFQLCMKCACISKAMQSFLLRGQGGRGRQWAVSAPWHVSHAQKWGRREKNDPEHKQSRLWDSDSPSQRHPFKRLLPQATPALPVSTAGWFPVERSFPQKQAHGVCSIQGCRLPPLSYYSSCYG